MAIILGLLRVAGAARADNSTYMTRAQAKAHRAHVVPIALKLAAREYVEGCAAQAQPGRLTRRAPSCK